LKSFLTDKPVEGRLRESNIVDAYMIQLLEKGLYIVKEKPIRLTWNMMARRLS